MIRSLPIYKAPPPTPLDKAPTFEVDPNCSMCAHAGGKNATCLPHQGEVGGLLIVDSFPTTTEARGRRHLASAVGNKLRLMAERSEQPVAYVHALRCAPKGGASGESAAMLVPGLTECLPYLKGTIAAIKPTRIIALGAPAIYSLTGAMVTPSTTRGGFAWIKLAHGWVPVFYGISPADAAKNKFLEAWLLEDFDSMLSDTPHTPPPEVGETWAKLVVDEASARRCLEKIKTARWTAVDCEWAGRPYDKDFKLLSLAMTPAPDRGLWLPLAWDHEEPCLNAWVWTQEALQNPACVAMLKEWLRDPTQNKVGSYFKSDTVALHAALGIWTRGVAFDTRLLRKLMDAEASGKLADMAHLVGRGGHKDELAEAKDKAVREYLSARAKGKGGLFTLKPPNLATQSHCDKLAAGAEKDCYGFAFVDPELLYRYNAADTVVTSLVGGLLERRLAEEPEGMRQVANLTVIPAGDTYARVESWGLRVDRESLETLGQYLDVQINEVEERLQQYGFDRANPKAGKFQPGSPASLGKFLFGELGLKSERTTDTGKPATDAESLEELKDQHPVVNDILSWRGLTKMKASYVENMLGYIRDDGRVHPTVHPDGARTGRTSCVAGWTPVITSEGIKPICDVRVGDLVWTHRERWRRVTHFLPQGVRPVFDVTFCNGDALTCTSDHRVLLASQRWATVEELKNDNLKEVDFQSRKSRGGATDVSQCGLKADGADCQGFRDFVPQCTGCAFSLSGPSGIHSLENTSIFSLKDRKQESDVPENWRGAPQLERGVRRRTRLSDGHLEWEAPFCASHRHAGGSRDPRPAERVCGAPYRRGQEEQCAGQPCACYTCGTQAGSLFTGQGQLGLGIKEINPSGSCEVFDLTVEEDESYWTLGVFSHNCSHPNLQVMPSMESSDPTQAEMARMFRDCFAPPPGHSLLEIDYSQLELRVAADLSGDPAMLDIFINNLDFHMQTARLLSKTLWGLEPDQITDTHRREAKPFVFGLLYDDDPYGLAMRVGVTKEKAAQIKDAVFGCYPMLGKWIKERVSETSRTGHAWTWWAGHPARRRPLIESVNLETSMGKTQRRASWNTPVQGTGNEYLVASAIQVVDWLVNDGVPAKLLVTIHDSMLLEVRNDAMSEVRDRVLEIMCSHRTKNGVPLAADAKCGPTWARMVKWKAGQPCPLEGCV